MKAHANPTVTVLLPSQDTKSLIEEAIRALESGSTILDLTAGRVGGESLVRGHVETASEERWIDGQAFEAELAEPAQAEHVRWLARMADEPLWNGKSLKELFVYRTRSGQRLSLWWLSGLSRRGITSSPYTWLFFAFAVIRAVETDRQPGDWAVMGGDKVAQDAVASWVGAAVTAQSSTPRESRWRGLRRSLGLVRRLASETRRIGGRLHAPAQRRTRILLQSCYPHDWSNADAAGVEAPGVHALDKYYGDLPWQLEKWGGDVIWLPLVSARDINAWDQALSRQPLPDARAYMRFGLRDAVGILRQLVGWWRTYVRAFRSGRAESQITYHGVPMGGWVRQELVRGLWGGYAAHLVLLERQRRAIEHFEPDIVLHRNDFLVQGRVTAVAATGVSEAVALQHGLLTQSTGVYQYAASEVGPAPSEPGTDYVHHCPMPDRLAAFGEYTKEYFGQWEGYDPSRVFVTGGVRHDALVNAFPDTAASRERLALPLSGAVVACCVTFPEDVRRVLPGLGDAIAGMDEVTVVVKPHPLHDTSSLIETLGRRHLGARFTLRTDDIYLLLASADLLVCGPSTVSLEAYLFGTPVISFGEGSYEAFPFSREGIGVRADTPSELADAIRTVLRSGPAERDRYLDDRARVLARHLDNADAGACRRLAIAIGLDVPPL